MWQAIVEFLDNSYGNNAANTVITALGDKEYDIIVADDGTGMSPEGLIESLTFALRKDRSPCEISEFGVGLKAAAFGLTDSWTIVTRSEEHGICCATLDYEKICETGEYDGPHCQGSKSKANRLWKNHAIDPEKTGTIIVLEKVNRKRKDYKEARGFIKGLENPLRLRWRYAKPLKCNSFSIATKLNKGKLKLLQTYDRLHRDTDGVEPILTNVSYCIDQADYCMFKASMTNLAPANLSGNNGFGLSVQVAGINIHLDSDELLGMFQPGASHSRHWPVRMELVFDNKVEFNKILSVSARKTHLIKAYDGLGNSLRDKVFGTPLTKVKKEQEELANQNKVLKEHSRKEKIKKGLLNLLKGSNVYGPSKALKSHFAGKIQDIVPGTFNNSQDISRIKGNCIEYNLSNPQLQTLAKGNIRNAWVLSVVNLGKMDNVSHSDLMVFNLNLQAMNE
ncbi:MAG: ATP-binding protein [Cyanophyceae cyanobacterium]